MNMHDTSKIAPKRLVGHKEESKDVVHEYGLLGAVGGLENDK